MCVCVCVCVWCVWSSCTTGNTGRTTARSKIGGETEWCCIAGSGGVEQRVCGVEGVYVVL